MIEGVVNADHEAVITLSLSHPTGRTLEVEAVIDTGYNGFLTLPAELVADMALPFVGPSRATLANGAVETFDVYEATILWDGQSRDIEADATGGIPPRRHAHVGRPRPQRPGSSWWAGPDQGADIASARLACRCP